MERVHYRRVTESGRNTPSPSEGGGLKEKLITQAIVSGLVLAFMLTIRLSENPLAARLHSELHRMFEGYTTADTLLSDIQELSMEYLNLPSETDAVDWLKDFDPAPIRYINEENAYDNTQLTATPDESKSPVPELSAFPEP